MTIHAVGYAAPWVYVLPAQPNTFLGLHQRPLFSCSWLINGGPVLRWRGPFFFLPTNPLYMAHIPNLWERPIRLLERRHRGTQLATTSNLHFPAVAEVGLGMEFRILGATQVQLAVNILLNTDSPVCACCNKFSNQMSKFNKPIIHHSPNEIKRKFPTQEPFPFEDYGCSVI